jgi:hypothetical protein
VNSIQIELRAAAAYLLVLTGKGASASIVASNSGRTNAAKPRASAGGYPTN